MSRRKAACGTKMPKVGGEVVKAAHPASYTRLNPLMEGVAPQGFPDPVLFARVIAILRQLKQAYVVLRSMSRHDGRRQALSERIEMLRQDLRAAVDRDATGLIYVALKRAEEAGDDA